MTELVLVLPELALLLTVVGIFAGEAGHYGERVRLSTIIALLGLGSACIQSLLTYQYGSQRAFDGAFTVDGMAIFFKVFFSLSAALVITILTQSKEIPAERRTEATGLIVAAVLAANVTVSATHLVLLFVAMTFLGATSMLACGLGKSRESSAEGAAKLYLVGGFSSAVFLFASGVIFAATQSLSFPDIHATLLLHPFPRTTALVVFVLFILSLGWLALFFPMNMAGQDALDGAPTPVSAFLAIVPRAAALVLLLRLTMSIFATAKTGAEGSWDVFGTLDWTQILEVVCGLTLFAGALLSMRQTSAKRMVAFLMMVQTGFALMGMLVLNSFGLVGLLYSLLIEVFAAAGIYFVLARLIDASGGDRFDQLRGVLGKSPYEGAFFIFFLATLIGLPPAPGFIGKFMLVGAVAQSGRHMLAVVALAAVATTTISFAKLTLAMLGKLPLNEALPGDWPGRYRTGVLGLLGVPIVLIGVFAEPVIRWAEKSLALILW